MTASYTFTINSQPMPLPAQDDGIQMEYFPIGVSGRTADATYRVQHVANKWRVRVVWKGLTAAERATVWAAYGGYIATSTTVVFPNGLTLTAFVDLASWAEAHWYDPHKSRVLYNVSFTVVEA